jgi:hypothetical protein
MIEWKKILEGQGVYLSKGEWLFTPARKQR